MAQIAAGDGLRLQAGPGPGRKMPTRPHDNPAAPVTLDPRGRRFKLARGDLADYVVTGHRVFVFVVIGSVEFSAVGGRRARETRRASVWDAPPRAFDHEPRTNDSAVTLSLAPEVVA
jgi:hypothetical protein